MGMRRSFLFCVVLLSLPSIAISQSANQWYEGGTLHKSRIENWIAASYGNRLATSADFFISISKERNPGVLNIPSSKFVPELRRHAVELEKCITEICKEPKASKGALSAEIAAMCYLTIYKVK